jgi:hypothetical protein
MVKYGTLLCTPCSKALHNCFVFFMYLAHPKVSVGLHFNPRERNIWLFQLIRKSRLFDFLFYQYKYYNTSYSVMYHPIYNLDILPYDDHVGRVVGWVLMIMVVGSLFKCQNSLFKCQNPLFKCQNSVFKCQNSLFKYSKTPFSNRKLPFQIAKLPFQIAKTPFSNSKSPFSNSKTPFSNS